MVFQIAGLFTDANVKKKIATTLQRRDYQIIIDFFNPPQGG